MQSWVIKIGGSLYSSEYLIEWLEAIARNADCKILLVPGGGPFADLVRQADNTFNLDQDHAHRMAVMAMQQYGTFLASLCPKLQLADSRGKIQQLWDSGHAVIWEAHKYDAK